jgi:hypothetical protein
MAASKQARQYEFPNGYNTFYGPERYRLGESFFSHLPGVSVRLDSRAQVANTLINHGSRVAQNFLKR